MAALPQGIEIVSHRGANYLAPENTIASADSALAHGATWIEVDVRQSKDGVLFNLHDETLDRTTNGHEPISAMNSNDIEKLDAGYKYSNRYKGTKVPTIAEMLDHLRNRSKVFFDVKRGTDVSSLIRLVHEKGFTYDSFFWFGDTTMLKTFVSHAPEMRVKVNVSNIDGIKQWAKLCQPSFIEVSPDNITEAMKRFCHDRGIRIMAAVQGLSEGDYKKAILKNPDLINLDSPELYSKLVMELGIRNENISNEQMGGIYYAYHPDTTSTRTPAPKGFHPFYISHYGRHGSRWLPSDSRYEWVLSQFADTLNLTPLGKDVHKRIEKIWADAEGRGGDLTSIGAKQQAGIAERMFKDYKEVFKGYGTVSAKSSISGRCAMSMTAFLLRLQSLNPSLRITAESNRRFMKWIAWSSPAEDSLIARVSRTILCSPDRLMKSLFIRPDKVSRPMDLFSELHCIASDMQDVGIGVSLYDIFTPKEIRAVYEASNENMWTCNSHNAVSNGIPERSAISLWENIVNEADSAIKNGKPQATLRFGHDTSLYRLYTLLGIMNSERRMDKIIPMGANLAIVFYRNDKNKILVKFMHNEGEISLPTEIQPINSVYYDWNKVKNFYSNKIKKLSSKE